MNDQKPAAEVAANGGAPAPGVGAPSRYLRRRVVFAEILALVAFLLAAVAMYRVHNLRVHHSRLLRSHNDLIQKLNRERTGLGATLDAVGVPGGKIIGGVLDELDKALKPKAGRRRPRRGFLRGSKEPPPEESASRRR